MTHGSLFSGIGGAELAASWMGWENKFHCEINSFCRKILKYHFPESISYEDITKTDFSEWRGQIDVLTGGFPCQPFSLAGQRKGAEDNRYLWPQMLRAIREIRPTWVVGENVAGILTMVQPGEETEVGNQSSLFGESDRKRVLHRQEYVTETICGDLEREGYSVQPVVIPACAVGAPHRRDRVWFIAHADGGRCNDGFCDRQERQFYYNKKRDAEENQSEWAERKCWVGENDFFVANSERNGSDKIYQDLQSKISNGKRIDSNGMQRNNIADTESKQSEWCKPEQFTNGESEQGKFGRSSSKNNSELTMRMWQDFPTQSPVCSGDDGFPAGLDGITFSQWRQESIKAYGNAWVPQVAYEIFRLINQVNQDENQRLPTKSPYRDKDIIRTKTL